MNSDKPLLAIAGDIGGARAILPGLAQLERRDAAFAIADHRFLANEAPLHWPRVTLPADSGELREVLVQDYQACVFGTSVADPYPLRVARAAMAAGVPTIAVLDNWMNYRNRLAADGHPVLIPDAYAVMDELARTEAIADGVPESCLRIVGHAGLATLVDEYAQFRLGQSGANAPDRKLLVFISEPAEQDQGADHTWPGFRGYTEKTVLTLLLDCLQPYHKELQIGLVPHPRENSDDVQNLWDRCRGKLTGGQMLVRRGRDAVFRADAVCGMSSLLLFEAMLIGKPVLSLQPGLRVHQLDFLRKKGLTHFVTDASSAPESLRGWLTPVLDSRALPAPLPEIELHRRAPSVLADLIQEVGGNRL